MQVWLYHIWHSINKLNDHAERRTETVISYFDGTLIPTTNGTQLSPTDGVRPQPKDGMQPPR